MDTEDIRSSGEDKLPFDPRTLILGLWRRRRTLVWIGLGACILGALGGLFIGKRTYETDTVLLYKPIEAGAPSLQTLMNMVKVQPNLSEVRERLNLNATLESLGASCDVNVHENTNLLTIQAQWDSPEKAAAIANTLRDVFVNNQQHLRKTVTEKEVQDLEDHLAFVRRQLKAADDAQQQYASNSGPVDLDKESQDYLNQLSAIDRLYQQAQVENEEVSRAMANPTQPIHNVGISTTDQRSLPPELDGLSGMDTRIQWALNALRDEKTERINMAELTKVQKEYEQAQVLWKKGLISENEYQSSLAAYKKQQALTSDTKQSEAWKNKLQTLMETRLKRLQDARSKVKAKLAGLPQMQRQYIEIHREVEFWEAQRQALETQLASARRAYESKASDFSVVSEAEAPPMPLRSNRRLLAAALAMIVCMLGFGYVCITELLNTTIKSEAEYELKLSAPLFGVLPGQPADSRLLPGLLDSELIERFRGIACRIRQSLPQQRNLRILVAGAENGEGTTVVATNLAACFGRQDERVLLIDAQIHSGVEATEEQLLQASAEALMVDDRAWLEKSRYTARELVSHKGMPVKGLGEYLSFEASEIDEIVWPTSLPGVSCIPHVGKTVVPDMVCSNRMRDLIAQVSERFSLVLIDAPPVLRHVDASVLAQSVDAVVFVVRSQKCRASSLQKAIDRLKPAGVPVMGAVLNDVDPLFLGKNF